LLLETIRNESGTYLIRSKLINTQYAHYCLFSTIILKPKNDKIRRNCSSRNELFKSLFRSGNWKRSLFLSFKHSSLQTKHKKNFLNLRSFLSTFSLPSSIHFIDSSLFLSPSFRGFRVANRIFCKGGRLKFIPTWNFKPFFYKL